MPFKHIFQLERVLHTIVIVFSASSLIDIHRHRDWLQQLRQEYSLCRLYKKSKTLRAFDRRPIADGGGSNCPSGQVFAGHLNCEDTTTIPSDRDHGHRYYQTTTGTYTINPPQEVQRLVPIDSSSPDSSSSFGETSHGDRVADDEAMLPIEGIDPLWEWINGWIGSRWRMLTELAADR